MKKAARPSGAFYFEQIPNIGKEIAEDLRRLGLKGPHALKGKDPYRLYQALCKKDGMRYDPCMLDTLMAAVYFMNGRGAKPWWTFTKDRKKKFPKLYKQKDERCKYLISVS